VSGVHRSMFTRSDIAAISFHMVRPLQS
jgi:hypothetical protein